MVRRWWGTAFVLAAVYVILGPPALASVTARPKAASICLNWRVRASDALAATLRVPPRSTLVLFSDGKRSLVPKPDSFIVEAILGPGDSLVAFQTEGQPPQVIVTTFDGTERARFRRSIGFAWCPEAPLLAIIRGMPNPSESEDVPIVEGVSVWDASIDARRDYRDGAFEIGWLGSDTLLLETARGLRDLDLRSGFSGPSRHRGPIVSPDRRYSVSVSHEGSEMVWDSETRTDVTGRVLDAAGTTVLTGDLGLPPFWVNGRPHDLCVRGFGKQVVVVDVGDMKQRVSSPGRFLTSTSDRSGALVQDERGIHLVVFDP